MHHSGRCNRCRPSFPDWLIRVACPPTALLFLLAFCLFLPRPVAANAIANSNIDFFNLSIAPSNASLALDDVWVLETFASANNSLGENDARFDLALSPASLGVVAVVTFATGSASATALSDPADLDVTAGASSSVNIPGCNLVAAFSEGRGTLSNFFTVSGTGSVAVQFAIDISGDLTVMTDACGLSAFTQTIFSLEVDGVPVLFDQRVLNIGRSSAQMLPFSAHLTNSIVLDAGVSHFMLLQADSESRAQTAAEPSSISLFAISAGVLMWARRRGRASEAGARWRPSEFESEA